MTHSDRWSVRPGRSPGGDSASRPGLSGATGFSITACGWLAVCVLLSKHDAMSFSRLKQVLGETDGSLGTHLRKLEEAGYLGIEKTYRGRRPVTWYQLTAAGRSRLQQHVASLMRLIERTG